MRIVDFLFLGILLATLSACSPKFETRFANTTDIELLPVAEQVERSLRSSCDSNLYYVADTNNLDHIPMRYVRLNYHFMNSTDGKNNIPPGEQEEYIKGLEWVLNKSIETNKKMRLPIGNQTIVYPVPYRYVRGTNPAVKGDNGIYNHYDDELYYFVKEGKNRNNSDRRVLEKYAINRDSVINIFLMPHHPDSVISKTYRADGSGIALGTDLKVSGQWKNKPDTWNVRGLFHHEIGHVLGLAHTWNLNDGCDDTPKHSNCFNYTKKPPCDLLVSNNLMDYNAAQNSWSPCQIGKVMKNFARLNSASRKVLKPNWCSYRKDRHIFIEGDINWFAARDLEGDITIKTGATLTIHCRTSMPPASKIIVEPGAKLILDGARLHNACGVEWQGIEVQQLGKKKGIVQIASPSIVENNRNAFSHADDR